MNGRAWVGVVVAALLGGCGEEAGGDAEPIDTASSGEVDSGAEDGDAEDDDAEDTAVDDDDGDDTSDSSDDGECGDGRLDDGELCDDGNEDPGDGCDSDCDPEVELDIPYNLATAAATHNSYAGAFGDGDVGSITEQLDSGIRTLELDIHTDDFEDFGYRVGHDDPGDEVALGAGNPADETLDGWLELVASWSDAHPTHAPITLYIDLKDEPDSHHPSKGNFGAFNVLLERTLGERLYTPDNFAADAQWPDVEEMQGQVVVVLTGDEDGQLAYRRDRGLDPAIAINDLGQVIEVHQSESNSDDMWLWTGQVQADGSIQWMHHADYDTGNAPAVAINNDGLIIEVHEDPDWNDNNLWYRVGRIDENYVVQWSTDGGQQFPGGDDGEGPTVAFVDLDGVEVREVHQSSSNDQRWYWSATVVDETGGTVQWDRPLGDGKTDDGFYPRASVSYGGAEYTVSIADDGPHQDVLLYSGPSGGRVRYTQLAFGSARASSKEELANDGLEFFAEDAREDSGRDFAAQKREQGKVTRLWRFDEALRMSDGAEPINFAATDHPFADWYVDYCDAVGCVR